MSNEENGPEGEDTTQELAKKQQNQTDTAAANKSSSESVSMSDSTAGASETSPTTSLADKTTTAVQQDVSSQDTTAEPEEGDISMASTENKESESSPSTSSPTPSPTTANTESPVSPEPAVATVKFKCIFSGKKYEVELPVTHTIRQLKEHLSLIIDVVPTMQKIMIKGLATDDKTLQELGVTKVSKVLVVGSKFDDVLRVNAVSVAKPGTSSRTSETSSATTTALSTQKLHQKIIDKGPPDDVQPGIKGRKDPLPPTPLSGMVTKSGGKVRLTFKLELDQLWIGTKQRTEKINMASIKNIVSEPIHTHDQYHILGIQLGPTDASRYWIYWVPAQYVDAIKSTVMGGSLW